MLFDGINMAEGSHAVNLTVETVSSLPSTGNQGELIFNTTDKKLYQFDGQVWQIVLGTSGVYDVQITLPIATPTSAIIPAHVAVRTFNVPANFSGCKAYAEQVAASLVPFQFSLNKNGVEFGSVVFMGGSKVGSFSTTSETQFVPGDVLTIGTPSDQNLPKKVVMTLKTTLVS